MSPRQTRVLAVAVMAEMSAVAAVCARLGEYGNAIAAAVLALLCDLHLIFEK